MIKHHKVIAFMVKGLFKLKLLRYGRGEAASMDCLIASFRASAMILAEPGLHCS